MHKRFSTMLKNVKNYLKILKYENIEKSFISRLKLACADLCITNLVSKPICKNRNCALAVNNS